jgi:hypothetical protein
MKLRTMHPFPEVTMEWGGTEYPSVEVDELGNATPESIASMGDGSETSAPVTLMAEPERPVHPDATTKGIELALGFMPHQGENRRTRRAESARWTPPKLITPKTETETAGAAQSPPAANAPNAAAPAPRMPTRRELLKQRQKQRLGKLDPELRRLQRKAAKQHV